MNKPNFYEKLSEKGKQQYDTFEKFKPHSEKFIKLMNQEEPSKDTLEGMFYTEKEREFLGKEDLVTLGNLHPADAEFYMLCD